MLLCTEDHHIVGYCPRYIVDDVFKLKNKKSELLKVKVERVNPVPATLQLRLLCNMTAEWHEDFRPFSSREYQPLVADIPMAYASS